MFGRLKQCLKKISREVKARPAKRRASVALVAEEGLEPPTRGLWFLLTGWLLGRAYRSLSAETGGRKGPVGSRLRQIQPLAHLDDLYSFAARF